MSVQIMMKLYYKMPYTYINIVQWLFLTKKLSQMLVITVDVLINNGGVSSCKPVQYIYVFTYNKEVWLRYEVHHNPPLGSLQTVCGCLTTLAVRMYLSCNWNVNQRQLLLSAEDVTALKNIAADAKNS